MRRHLALLAICFLSGCVAARADEAVVAIPSLEDRQWTIESYNDGVSLVHWSDVFGHIGWIRFSDGTIDGASACGGFIGTYRLTENEITLEVGSIVAGSCIRRDGREPANTAPLNVAVLNALNGTRTITRDQDGFALRDASGQTQIVLTAPEGSSP